MRTIEQIQAHITELSVAESENEDWMDEDTQDGQYNLGMRAGFKRGLKMTQEGKTTADILAYAKQDEQAYKSHGDDLIDAHQSGYTCALQWCGCAFDWDDDGYPIFYDADGNVVDELAR